MVQVTSILLAIIIMVILLVAVLVILSGTVPGFQKAIGDMINVFFPSTTKA